MTLSRGLLLWIGLVAIAASANAESPRTSMKGPPRIGGREVKELVLTTPVKMGTTLPRGMPSGLTFKIRPNRFLPVSEDATDVYYQAEGAFPAGRDAVGGLMVNKSYPDKVCAYFGDGRDLTIKLGPYDCLLPGDVRKIRIRFVQPRTKS